MRAVPCSHATRTTTISTSPFTALSAALLLGVVFFFGANTGTNASAAPFAYVPNQKSGSISVIDTGSDKVVRTLTAHNQLGKRLRAQ